MARIALRSLTKSRDVAGLARAARHRDSQRFCEAKGGRGCVSRVTEKQG